MYFYSFKDRPKLNFKSDEKIDGVNRRRMSRSPCLIPTIYYTDKCFDVGKKLFLDLIFQSNQPTPGHKYFYGTIKWSTDIHMGIQFN